MTDGKLWCWTSPVWAAAAVLLLAYLAASVGRSRGQLAILLVGLGLLVLAFVSPVGVLAEGYLFSAHMVQHLVLLLVVPACLLLALPSQAAERSFNRPLPDRVGRLLATAPFGWVCGVGAMWFWHVPQLCSTAALNPAVGVLRDCSLVASGIAFWWPIYAPCERYRMPPLSGIGYLFSACLGCTLLGVYITFAPLSVCPAFANPADRIGIMNSLYNAGLTPGIDQHIGGLLMWAPPCVLYIGAIIGLLGRWYAAHEPQPNQLAPAANNGV
ncbi:Cytochrome c oxidase caa3 assembly factor (Caa3_CtaG) [Posidoniimonas corsicana]|uniref:Cytochrome c oxidase caa3 assembly factor (Caa3_CtaG) n=1 Tax=Posidoniimonas corsicana TaxID=1938618 RepID=A0A5C5VAS2_9BACT|nr:cytochrome c oxidase assembly protein [Posidoniimonas corsicana]TWT35401.1 Cytochrome c oxidase caa3 assembly factor (Caa3_CtaG) [Posidoniimonas corsicana]